MQEKDKKGSRNGNEAQEQGAKQTEMCIRDRALELIAAWLPDVEKFSKEISKQRAYIDSLKAVSYTHLDVYKRQG